MTLGILKNRHGNVLVYVLVLAVAVTVTISALLAVCRQNYNSAVLTQLNTKAYYLTMEAADISIAGLLKGDSPYRVIDYLGDGNLSRCGASEKSELDFGDENGKCYIKLEREYDDSVSAYWAVVYITTVIPDNRVNLGDAEGVDKTYELYYILKLLVDNPDVRAFDMTVSDEAR